MTHFALFLVLSMVPCVTSALPELAAGAQGEVVAGMSTTGTRWLVVSESIARHAPDIVAFRARSIPAQPELPLPGEESTARVLREIQERYFGSYESTEAIWELDCGKQEFRIIFFSVYGKTGEVISSTHNISASWEAILPGSAGDAFRALLCPAGKTGT